MAQPPIIKLLRPHQWVKNVFLLAPLFFTPEAINGNSVLAVLGGMLCFCAVSSAVYILNDYFDRESDRQHPVKCQRPLASGKVAVPIAFMVFGLLLAAGFASALALSSSFAIILAGYFVINCAYSIALKQVAILDVMLIAFGFVLRVEAGAEVVDVTASAWIVVMTGLLALFLGFAKRRDDLVKDVTNEHRRSLTGYSKQFLDMTNAMLGGALIVAYLTYTTDQAVMERLGTDKLFYTAPFVVFGILRYLQICLIEERSGSPTRVLLTDGWTIGAIAGWLITFGLLIYT